jgi:hypothetical protein
VGKFPAQLTGKPREFEIVSRGRRAPPHPRRFTHAEVSLIAHTVRRAPEVMVKVTGGGVKAGAVSAHLTYISRRGELEVENDDGRRLKDRTELNALLEDWRLDLTSGQYRPKNQGRVTRSSKLVHNIVLSMPSRTPPDKVLSAAKKFARERFALQHRYALVLHDDQANPHVHLVVKAESESGKRLHIDKAMLRDWREQFAALMREQGIAANATPRAVRGKNPRKVLKGLFGARQYGESTADQARIEGVVHEIYATGGLKDPVRRRLLETRKALEAGWEKVAATLEDQGERTLAAEVRGFARQLPVVGTDRQKIALRFLQFKKQQSELQRHGMQPNSAPRARGREDELTR